MMIEHYIYSLVLFVLGVSFCLHFLVFGRVKSNRLAVKCWNVLWRDFIEFSWWIIMTALLVILALKALNKFILPESAVMLRKVMPALVSQSSFLVLIVYFYKKLPGFKLGFNYSPKIWVQGVYVFLCTLPILGGVNVVWQKVLKLLNEQGIADPVEPQVMVKLMNEKPSFLILVLIVVPAVCFAPITEEAIFRGGIYRFLKSRWSPRGALILSSLFFASMHFNMGSFLPLFLFGLLLGWAYEATGRLWVSIVFHGIFNLNTFIMLLLKQL